MPPAVPSVIQCTSNAQLQHELQNISLSVSLSETEDSWENIARAIQRLTALCKGGACDFASDIVSTCRTLSRPISSALRSERSRLSGAATDLISAAATGLQSEFDLLVPIFIPVLLDLCTRTSKLLVTRARGCLSDIIENTLLPSILPILKDALKDKSITLRIAATEGVAHCLNCFNPPDIEKESRVEDIEGVIRSTVRDANPDVRKASRKVFEAYQLLLPGRIASFVAPLSPTTRKYLNVSALPTSNHSSRPTSAQSTHSVHFARPQVVAKPHFSSSTSAIPGKSMTEAPQQIHLRSNSSSAAVGRTHLPTGNGRAGSGLAEPSRAPANHAKPLGSRRERSASTHKDAMLPPDFIPARPAASAPQRVATTISGIGLSTTAADHASRQLPPTGGARRVRCAVNTTASTPSTSAATHQLSRTGGARRVPLPPPHAPEKTKRVDLPPPARVASKPPPQVAGSLPARSMAPLMSRSGVSDGGRETKPSHATVASKVKETKIKKPDPVKSVPPPVIAHRKGPADATNAPPRAGSSNVVRSKAMGAPMKKTSSKIPNPPSSVPVLEVKVVLPIPPTLACAPSPTLVPLPPSPEPLRPLAPPHDVSLVAKGLGDMSLPHDCFETIIHDLSDGVTLPMGKDSSAHVVLPTESVVSSMNPLSCIGTQSLHPLADSHPFVLEAMRTPPRGAGLEHQAKIAQTPISALVLAIQQGFLEASPTPTPEVHYDPYGVQTTYGFEGVQGGLHSSQFEDPYFHFNYGEPVELE